MSDGQARAHRRRRRPLAAVGYGLVGLVGVVLVGCAGSGFQYVSNPDLGVFFKLPAQWTVMDEDDLTEREGRPSRRPFGSGGQDSLWLVVFDAAPKPSLEHFLDEGSTHPAGLAQARLLEPEERDGFSLASLRNEVIPLDDLAESSQGFRPLRQQDIELPDGTHGHRGVYLLSTRDGGSYTYDQTALVDATVRTAYVLAIGCGTDCYERHRDVIDTVVSSWTIKEQRP